VSICGLTEVKLELHATPEEVMRAVESLQEFGRSKGIPEKTLFGLALALEECGSNIVNYALRRDPARKFEVVLEHTPGAMTIELRDSGPEFDPTRETVPLSPASEEELGGWGLQLVRRYMDQIRYVREKGENVLRLTKRLNEAAG
jgi:anti-sigma regulatory factor (Ser/Thr protein kinase)